MRIKNWGGRGGLSHAEAQRERGREAGEGWLVLEEKDYKLRGATKSFANATLRASRVSPILLNSFRFYIAPSGLRGGVGVGVCLTQRRRGEEGGRLERAGGF